MNLRDGARRAVINRFHCMYYARKQSTWLNTRWAGVSILKNPLDLWVYQELIWEHRPDLIIETGTAHGGSALYLSAILDQVGNGRIITIDIAAQGGRPQHSRIEYVTASSTSPETFQRVAHACLGAEAVMVILDSDHSERHVLEEMRLYSDLVTPGCHLIVEDSNVNGHPVSKGHGPGPMEAIGKFLIEDDRFEVDAACEKFMFTFNPGGYLRRLPS